MQIIDLTPEHIGRCAIVLGRQGILTRAQVPGYGPAVTAWYLVTPSPLPQFEEEAVSLQWAADAEVTLIAVSTCTKCDGSGVFFDITNADRVNAGPLANQCAACRGRGVIEQIEMDPAVKAREAALAAAAMPEWDDTQELPAWMCGIDDEQKLDA